MFFRGFRFFGLSIRVRLITLRVRIYFVPPYKIHLDIFYISDRVQIGFFGSNFGLRILCPCLVTATTSSFCDISMVTV